MKHFILILSLFLSSIGHGQELMNFYVEPNSNPNSITLHTKVFYFNLANYVGVQINETDNTINVSLCYIPTIFTAPTFDYQNFEINLPPGFSNYTIELELYADVDAPCNYSNLIDTGTINFAYPFEPTETVYIPDNNFENLLEDLGFGDDVSNNDLVFEHRVKNITRFFLNNLEIGIDGKVEDATGIEAFSSLKYFNCTRNLIPVLDLSNSPGLIELSSWDNLYNELDFSENLNLRTLLCGTPSLTNINLSNNLLLERLEIGGDNMISIDITNNINLKTMRFGGSQIIDINLLNNTLLEFISFQGTPLNSLNLTNNLNLEILDCQNTELTSIDVNGLVNLKELTCYNSNLSSLNLSTNIQLEKVSLLVNDLTSLDLRNNNNENITTMWTFGNAELFCIDVDDPSQAPYPGWGTDSQTGYSEDCSLSVSNQEFETNILIYPNPFDFVLYIQNIEAVEINSITVYDILGKVILEISANTKSIDLARFPSGVLFVKIETDNGVLTKRLIKN
jgi:Leucine-rich repeat (LRR) protein